MHGGHLHCVAKRNALKLLDIEMDTKGNFHKTNFASLVVQMLIHFSV